MFDTIVIRGGAFIPAMPADMAHRRWHDEIRLKAQHALLRMRLN